MKILLAVDSSAFTKRMLAYLAAHEAWLGCGHRLTAFHVVPAVPPRAAAALQREALESYYNDEAEKVFKPLRTFFARHPDLQVYFSAQPGHAGETLAKVADRGGYDLVLMGSHGHGSLANLVLGSVATKVLARCKVPVLLVR